MRSIIEIHFEHAPPQLHVKLVLEWSMVHEILKMVISPYNPNRQEGLPLSTCMPPRNREEKVFGFRLET